MIYLAQAASVESTFLSQGVLGALCLILIGALVYQYKVNQSERKASQAREDVLLAKINELQDKRITEAIQHRDEVTEPLKQIATQQQRIYEQSIVNNSQRV